MKWGRLGVGLAIGLPALAGLAIYVLRSWLFTAYATGKTLVTTMTLQAEIPFLLLGVGVGISLLLGTIMLLRNRWQQRVTQATASGFERADEHHRRFLQRLDHELKNPLTAMLAGLESMAASEMSSENQWLLQSVSTQTQRLGGLVSELRQLNQIEEGKFQRSSVNTGTLLEDVFVQAKSLPEAQSRKEDLHLTIPRAWPGLPALIGNEDLLFLALSNLLHNALKFSKAGDKIELSAFRDTRHVVIKVADTGPGIAASEKGNVWDEFFRGQGTHDVPGRGLGLSFVRTIIAKHGGEIALESEHGAGTEITVRLPVGG